MSGDRPTVGARASIRIGDALAYPSGEAGFSPDRRYPEYAFETLSPDPNPVYESVRNLFVQLGLDRERLDTPEWNPLGAYIDPGQSVFVLCNFVYHRRPQDSESAFQAKCTHGSVLRALADFALIAAGHGARIRFGNSPLQSCDWSRVLADSGADRVERFYADNGVDVAATDLRLFVTERSFLGSVDAVHHRERPGQAVEIDLRDESVLTRLPRGGRTAPFRISDYDPRRIESFHAGGSHRYVIHREILDADVVISLPKLKTHEKVGLTCGLKGFVGTVGHKDCLAHHRFGSPRIGGDEYPNSLAFLRPLSRFHDWLNRRPRTAPLQGALQIAYRNAHRVLRRLGATSAGAWHGNDTAWRMTLDLARIVHYADTDGRLSEEPARRHLLLLDGIVAGEGNGPLVPTPATAGTLLFCDNVAFGDRLACRLMGFDPARIPLIDSAFSDLRFPIAPRAARPVEIVLDGGECGEDDIPTALGRSFRPPDGWMRHLTR
jgi:uncharacterized protein (DUF362 family)